jgi:peptidoglycan/xylan/chitin deacetylase (PgdA/CDA1 family)
LYKQDIYNVCVTIDTEGDSPNNPNSTCLGINIVLPKLLELFAMYNIKATFFIQEDEIYQIGSGFIEMCKLLEKLGHEVGYHTHGLETASVEKKEYIIDYGYQRLKKLGFEPVSYRAGRYHYNYSIIKVLEDIGIKYDSSVVPGLKECFSDGILRCDHTDSPYQPYYPSYENHCKAGNSKILELPINRYPHVSHHDYKGILTGDQGNEEVLFDFFSDIRKDKLIIINLHPWHGLSGVTYRLARAQKYGRIRRNVLEFSRRCIASSKLINSSYILRLDNLFQHISQKSQYSFTTIRDAGKNIEMQKSFLPR